MLYSGFMRSENWASGVEGFDDLVDVADVDGSTRNNHNPRPETQQWQELSFSGPLVKNKAWFASSFQYWQEDIGSVFSDSERTGDRYHGQFKATWLMGSDHTMVANFATDPSFFNNLITDARWAEGTNYDQNQGGYFIQLRDTWTISPNAFLETQLFGHHQYLTARPSQEGLGPFQIVVSPASPLAYTGTYYTDQDRSTDRIRLSSALTWQKGTHRVKGGFDYSFMDYTGVFRAEDLTVNYDNVVTSAHHRLPQSRGRRSHRRRDGRLHPGHVGDQREVDRGRGRPVGPPDGAGRAQHRPARGCGLRPQGPRPDEDLRQLRPLL
jgi:hypothetical protein